MHDEPLTSPLKGITLSCSNSDLSDRCPAVSNKSRCNNKNSHSQKKQKQKLQHAGQKLTDKLFGKKKSSDSYMYTTILARHFPPLLLQPMGTMVIQNLSCFPTLLESNGSQWASNSTNTKN